MANSVSNFVQHTGAHLHIISSWLPAPYLARVVLTYFAHVKWIRQEGPIHLQAEISGQARISVSRPKFRPGILAWKNQAEIFGLEFQARIPSRNFQARIPSRNFQARIPSRNFNQNFFQKHVSYGYHFFASTFLSRNAVFFKHFLRPTFLYSDFFSQKDLSLHGSGIYLRPLYNADYYYYL